MNAVFGAVAQLLQDLAGATGLSYKEINIVAYYMVLPFVYVALVDRIIAKHYLKIVYLASWTLALFLIDDFGVFSDWLFDASVRFLLRFSAVGLDYVAASVVVCVVLPAIIFIGLCAFAYPSLRKRGMYAVGRKAPNQAPEPMPLKRHGSP